jgi:hypothetical protein
MFDNDGGEVRYAADQAGGVALHLRWSLLDDE